MPVERSSDPGRPQVLALVNPGAGSTHDEAVAEAVVALRELADVELVTPADGDELAGALAVQGDRRLVVLGGDGSAHAVAQSLQDAGRLSAAGPVGLVPLGTGNDLARGLGIPVDDLPTAARLALTGRVVDLEVMLDADGGVVVNAAHAGAGAVAAEVAAAGKPSLRQAAYTVGAVAAGATSSGWNLRVVVDGEVLHDGAEPVLMAAVAVGRMIGAGTPLAPGSTPHDGTADVVVSLATGVAARVGYALDLRRGTHGERDDVLTGRGRTVEVTSADGEPFPLSVDGEVQGDVARRVWTVHPAAWSVRVP